MTLVDTPATACRRTGPRRRSAASSPPSPARARRSSWRARPRPSPRASVTPCPISAVAAGGGVVVDADGNSLIDLGSGIAVTSVGNAHPQVVEAVQAQVAAVHAHVLHGLAVRGLRRRRRGAQPLTPGDHAKKTAAVQLGRRGRRERGEDRPQATRRSRPSSRSTTPTTAARTSRWRLTAKNMPVQERLRAVRVRGLPRAASLPVPRRRPDRARRPRRRAISIIEKQVGADNLAAIIIEPIQGEGGFIVPAPGFLPALVDWCRANGVVFIADEVQTGFARTGAWFASEHEGIVPDLIATAKGIAGGLPLSAVTGRAEIMDSAHGRRPRRHLRRQPDRLRRGARHHRDRTSRTASSSAPARSAPCSSAASTRCAPPTPASATCAAAAPWSRSNSSTPRPAPPTRRSPNAVAKYAHANGVVVLTCGTYGNVIRFLPPLTICDELLIEGLGVIAEGLKNA